MTANPDTIDADAPIASAIRQMNESGYRHLPVVQSERILGILSIRDLPAGRARADAARDRGPRGARRTHRIALPGSPLSSHFCRATAGGVSEWVVLIGMFSGERVVRRPRPFSPRPQFPDPVSGDCRRRTNGRDPRGANKEPLLRRRDGRHRHGRRQLLVGHSRQSGPRQVDFGAPRAAIDPDHGETASSLLARNAIFDTAHGRGRAKPCRNDLFARSSSVTN